MRLNFRKTNEKAVLPSYGTGGSAGLDLYACLPEPFELQPGQIHTFDTGVAMELPAGYEAQIRSRSGLAFGPNVYAFHGTIDSDYRDEIKVQLENRGPKAVLIQPNHRIAQMIIAPFQRVTPTFAFGELSSTDRKGGFGSTGQ